MYHIALPSGDKYAIVKGESFNIRSNAQKYAERMGWKDFFVATDEQRQIIESGMTYSASGIMMDTAASQILKEEIPEPDTTWMKEEGIPWNRGKRKAKKK